MSEISAVADIDAVDDIEFDPKIVNYPPGEFRVPMIMRVIAIPTSRQTTFIPHRIDLHQHGNRDGNFPRLVIRSQITLSQYLSTGGGEGGGYH